VNVTVAPVRPVGGDVTNPFKYFHSPYDVSIALTAYNATQSPVFPGPPATVVVIRAPEATVVGDTVTVAAAAAIAGDSTARTNRRTPVRLWIRSRRAIGQTSLRTAPSVVNGT
jgi:hypothetical protein